MIAANVIKELEKFPSYLEVYVYTDHGQHLESAWTIREGYVDDDGEEYAEEDIKDLKEEYEAEGTDFSTSSIRKVIVIN